MKNVEKYLTELCDLAERNGKVKNFSYAIGRNIDTSKLDLCIATKCAKCEFGPRYSYNGSRCTMTMLNWLFSEINVEENEGGNQ